VHDKDEGVLNHFNLVYATQTKGDMLMQACRYPPYGNQVEHRNLWGQVGGGPPRKPNRGCLGLYKGLTLLGGTPFEDMTEIQAAEIVAAKVDEDEREDRNQFEGANGRAIRTRAMVNIEALMAIQELLGRPVTVHLPGEPETRISKAHERQDGGVNLIWYHHQGRGYLNSWLVKSGETMEWSSSDSESEVDVRDIPWGEDGAEGFWDWSARKQPIPADLLTQILIQKQDGQVVTESQGRPLLV